MLKSRKGSYLVEAAVLYPIIVVITVMMFVIFIYFFMNIDMSYRMAHESRLKAGYESGTVIYETDQNNIENFDVQHYRSGLVEKIKVSNVACVRNDLMYSYIYELKYSMEHSVINEAKLIWDSEIIKKILDAEDA